MRKNYISKHSKLIKEPLFEMANLDPDETGLDHGFIYVSTSGREGHYCRIKYFDSRQDLESQQNALIISIPELLIVIDNPKLSDNIKKQVVQFGIINTKKLLNFWNNGQIWDNKTVKEFLDTLKVSIEDIQKSRKLILKYK